MKFVFFHIRCSYRKKTDLIKCSPTKPARFFANKNEGMNGTYLWQRCSMKHKQMWSSKAPTQRSSGTVPMLKGDCVFLTSVYYHKEHQFLWVTLKNTRFTIIQSVHLKQGVTGAELQQRSMTYKPVSWARSFKQKSMILVLEEISETLEFYNWRIRLLSISNQKVRNEKAV